MHTSKRIHLPVFDMHRKKWHQINLPTWYKPVSFPCHRSRVTKYGNNKGIIQVAFKNK